MIDNSRAAKCWADSVGTEEAQLRAFFGTVMPNIPQKKVEDIINSKRPKHPVFNGPPAKDVAKMIAETKLKNKGLTPCIDNRYWCETCGSKSGECHPKTSMCFICDDDNWEPYNLSDVL